MPTNQSHQSFEIAHDSRESFSLPIALTPKKTLLIGAGAVAWQKFNVLQDSQWEVCVWAREIRDLCRILWNLTKIIRHCEVHKAKQVQRSNL